MILAICWRCNAITSLMKHRSAAVAVAVFVYILLASLLVLSVFSGQSVFPNELETIRTENRWSQWFRSKDADSIQSIQNLLHCCGFNSMRDRAYPFPSKKFNATECERNSGFSTHCGPLWRDQLQTAASLSLTASILEHLILVRDTQVHTRG